MRTQEENREYMSKYMSRKYAENIELSRQKSRENYYRNKHSCINQMKRIHKRIELLINDIKELEENNEDCSNELFGIQDLLLGITENIQSKI
jgi:hypothetical protein